MSSIIKLLRRIGGTKATPTTGEEGQLAVWKAGKTPTDATSLYFHDGNQWVELLDTSRNPRVIDANDTVAGLRITQRGSGEALRVEDEANPDATPFVIDNAGKVGIGMSAPEVSLDVAGRARFHTSAYIRTKIGSHSIYLREVAGSNHIDSYDDSLTGTYTNTPLEFNAKTYHFKTGGAVNQAITMLENGNVGIGIPAPVYPLHVTGEVRTGPHIVDTLGGAASIYMREIGGYNRIDSLNGTMTADHPLMMSAASYDFHIGTVTTLAIMADGKIVRGSQTPFVNTPYGPADISLPVSGAGLVIRNMGAAGASAPTTIVFQNNGGTAVGYISTSGTAVAYTNLSDYRLKENVAPLDNASARVKALRPVRFNFKADPASTIDGFLAHEVQAVVPEAVVGEKDNVADDGQIIPQGLDAGKLIPILTAALQDALKRIEKLEARP